MTELYRKQEGGLFTLVDPGFEGGEHFDAVRDEQAEADAKLGEMLRRLPEHCVVEHWVRDGSGHRWAVYNATFGEPDVVCGTPDEALAMALDAKAASNDVDSRLDPVKFGMKLYLEEEGRHG